MRRLRSFLPHAGADYARERNFDNGPGERSNVSALSPWIRHRALTESEVLTETLSRHGPEQAAKFVQEVFWRTYFKGWLEQRPAIWARYCAGLDAATRALDADKSLRERHAAAVAGRTGIDCFDAWVRELQELGYLHNHARMWFASIWIFTLRLPWELGADFFLRHLLDGDPASNTLGWRWVAGLHTRGKHYLARAANIAQYTRGRFDPAGQLAESAGPLEESEPTPAVTPLREAGVAPPGPFGLLITEEDCHPESLGLAGRPAFVTALSPVARSPLPLGGPALAFVEGIVEDAMRRAGEHLAAPPESLPAGDEAHGLLRLAGDARVETVVTAHAPAGPTAGRVCALAATLGAGGVELVSLRRDHDSAAWPFCTRGFFALRKKIPLLLSGLQTPGKT